jgi:hypothetical protein
MDFDFDVVDAPAAIAFVEKNCTIYKPVKPTKPRR